MTEQFNRMNQYCVICGKVWGPNIDSCCTNTSLIKINKVGLFKKKIEYYDLNGNALNEKDIQEIKERELEHSFAN